LNQPNHRECFGTMFPDVLHVENDRPQRGKVFSILLERAGGMLRSNREVTADIGQWDDCRQCPEWDDCYQFCMAKLLLASAIVTE
jgi:hypothetical protein